MGKMLSKDYFVKQLILIVGGPLVGKLMDHSPRIPAYICLNTVQVLAYQTLFTWRLIFS